MLHPMSHSTGFKIHLENDYIILHGSPEESAGVMLRGSIIFNCHEQTKVKSITLKFSGSTNVNWTEGTGSHTKHYKAERNILEKEWTFLKFEKKIHHLSQGQYKWDFELPLPGNLPESIHHEMGSVHYRLKAVCDRPALFSMNYVAKRDIQVTRVLLPTSLEFSQSVIISNVWANKVTYDISIPTKVYTCNKHIPISFDLLPLAPNLKIQSVAISLKEYTTVCTLDAQTTEGKIVTYLRDDHFFADEETGHIIKTELIQVPNVGINFGMSGELIQVKHKLRFTVSLQNADGHISELRAAIPVVIAPLLPEDDQNALPAYEDSWRSIPYDAETLAHMIAMGEVYAGPPSSRNSSETLSLSTSSGISSAGNSFYSEEDKSLEPVSWMGMDICRVPSYATALRTTDGPCTLSPSLPTYDSIAIH